MTTPRSSSKQPQQPGTGWSAASGSACPQSKHSEQQQQQRRQCREAREQRLSSVAAQRGQHARSRGRCRACVAFDSVRRRSWCVQQHACGLVCACCTCGAVAAVAAAAVATRTSRRRYSSSQLCDTQHPCVWQPELISRTDWAHHRNLLNGASCGTSRRQSSHTVGCLKQPSPRCTPPLATPCANRHVQPEYEGQADIIYAGTVVPGGTGCN